MESIGTYIRHARTQAGVSIDALSRSTRIKSEFLEDIEAQRWQKLPDFPVVSGFIKSISSSLNVPQDKALALLRRDYPPQKLPVNPKPDLEKTFVWTPQLSFFAAATVIVLAVSGYLGVQYYHFRKPPELIVAAPLEGETVPVGEYRVSGRTQEDARVVVNNQPAVVEETGSFEADIEVSETTSQIVITAISRTGRETQITRTITTQP